MNKIDMHIQIVRSSIIELSSLSLVSCDAIVNVLAKKYSRVGVSTVNNLNDLEALVALKPDLVFLGMKFVPMDESLGQQDTNRIWVADYLDEHNITNTGSNHLAHELELNKNLAKQRVQNEGFNTSPFIVVKQNQEQIETGSMTFPLFVKPANRGGGLGIDNNSVVYNVAALTAKVAAISADHHSDSLVEQYLNGREFSVAVLKKEDSAEYDVMPIELVATANEQGIRMLSGEVKASNEEQVLEVTDEDVRATVTTLALDVFTALGARDYGRIDIRMDESGTPYFLEANLIPSLISGYGSFPKACMLNIGLDHPDMILQITRLAIARNLANTNKQFENQNIVILKPAFI